MRSMKYKFFLLIFWGLLSSEGSASLGFLYECDEHSHSLVVRDAGFPNLYTNVRLNETVYIKEVQVDRWFVQEIECTNYGFSLNILKKAGEKTVKENHQIRIISNTEYEFI